MIAMKISSVEVYLAFGGIHDWKETEQLLGIHTLKQEDHHQLCMSK